MTKDPFDESAARQILERTLVDEGVPERLVSDIVESLFDALSVEGFYVSHESKAPTWMLPVSPGLYRVADLDEEL